MTRFTGFRRLLPLALALCAIPCAFGYIVVNLTTSGASPQTVQTTRADNAAIQFYLNSLIAASAQSTVSGKTVISAGSDPMAAAETAMASWNNVANANIHFNALQTTTDTYDPSNCMNVVSIGDSPADLSVFGFVSAASPGAVAVTVSQFVGSAGTFCGGTVTLAVGNILKSDILLNPYNTFSTDGSAGTFDLQAVLTHEFGHTLGLNHSTLLGTTMYPYSVKTQRYISADEKAFASATYPAGTGASGTISGTITAGSSPVAFGAVTMIDQLAGRTIDALTATDGTYSVQVPAGSYIVYAEPFNSYVGPLNIYSLSSSTGVLDPAQVTTAFEPTFLGTNNNPTVLNVTAGATATANIAVTSGASSLTAPSYGVGAAGGSGDIQSFSSLVGGAPLTSGQSLDIGFSGGGVDSTTSILVFGRGISVKAGSTRVDSSGVFRATLVIPAQTDVTLASLWLVRGTSILSLSGGLVIEPAMPAVSSVQDAESAQTSITSGQYAAIYGSNLANSSRTWSTSTDFTGGTAAGDSLPIVLDGTSVTVNSVPAAVYFVCAACDPNQINFIVPSGLTPGPASVVVSNSGTSGATFNGGTIAQASPSFFIYAAGGNYYPVAVHLNSALVGDPAVQSNATKALPGETIIMFANGLGPSPGGVVATPAAFTGTITMTAGSNPISVLGAALIYAGEYQINVQLPANIAPGNYTLTMNVPNGSTGGNGISVILPVGP